MPECPHCGECTEAPVKSTLLEDGVSLVKPVCECAFNCTLDIGMMALTGHQENCKHRGNDIETLRSLVEELVRGMERWASDEDGIHNDAWDSYIKGKALLIEPVPHEKV